VRIVLATLMAVMLAVMTTTDRVACVDGCTDDDQHASTSPTTSACGLCHGWNGPASTAVVAPVAQAVSRAPAPDCYAPSAYPPAIDHPPRVA